MIVCHCRGVSDRAIRHAVSSGARDLHEVARACTAGSGCGGCHAAIEEIVDREYGGGRASEILSLANYAPVR